MLSPVKLGAHLTAVCCACACACACGHAQEAERKHELDELEADRLKRVAIYYDCYVDPPPNSSRVRHRVTPSCVQRWCVAPCLT